MFAFIQSFLRDSSKASENSSSCFSKVLPGISQGIHTGIVSRTPQGTPKKIQGFHCQFPKSKERIQKFPQRFLKKIFHILFGGSSRNYFKKSCENSYRYSLLNSSMPEFHFVRNSSMIFSKDSLRNFFQDFFRNYSKKCICLQIFLQELLQESTRKFSIGSFKNYTRGSPMSVLRHSSMNAFRKTSFNFCTNFPRVTSDIPSGILSRTDGLFSFSLNDFLMRKNRLNHVLKAQY